MKQQFTMGLKGGKLPAGFSVNIPVSIEFDPIADQALMVEYCFGGSSARVALQAQLRTQKPDALRKLAQVGLHTTLADIKAGKHRSDAKPTPVELYKQQLAAMSVDDAVAKVVADTKQPREKALAFVTKVRTEMALKPAEPSIMDALLGEMAELDETELNDEAETETE